MSMYNALYVCRYSKVDLVFYMVLKYLDKIALNHAF